MIFLSQRMRKARGHQAKSPEITSGKKLEPRWGTGRRGQQAILKRRKGQLEERMGQSLQSRGADDIEDSTAARCSCSNSLSSALEQRQMCLEMKGKEG